jgi:mannose-1-phosphate guanylyltransferase
MLTFLIMAGGSGERFWPLSTKEKPKQLLSVFTDKSLIRKTFERILPLVENKNQIFIGTNEIQVKALKEELPELNEENIIIEPLFKDTAAAIGYGSIIISKYFENPTVAVLPSDALITEDNEFRKVIKIAYGDAQKDHIVTIGITPTRPETGYGYIEVEKFERNIPTKALSFKEKPNEQVAEDYIESKRFLWNAGMFIFKFDVIMKAFEKYAKSHYEVLRKIEATVKQNNGIKTANLVKQYFELFVKKSIDFAIMEYAANIYVIPASFGWDDVGSYSAFDSLFKKDENGNVVRSTVCVSLDSNNNIVVGSKQNLRVSLLDVHDKVIVYTDKELLICDKSRVQDIKKLISKLSGK